MMRNNYTILILSASLFLSMLVSCSFNRLSGDLISEVRFKPLETSTPVALDYSPETEVIVSYGSEFFYQLRTDEANYYQDALVKELSEANIMAGAEPARFSLSLTKVNYTEDASYECRTDTTNGEEYCFWLNDLTISISMEVFDHSTNKSNSFTSTVRESTKIKAKLFGEGYKESGDYIDLHNHLYSMMEGGFKKCAGRSAKAIRKFQKKHS